MSPATGLFTCLRSYPNNMGEIDGAKRLLQGIMERVAEAMHQVAKRLAALKVIVRKEHVALLYGVIGQCMGIAHCSVGRGGILQLSAALLLPGCCCRNLTGTLYSGVVHAEELASIWVHLGSICSPFLAATYPTLLNALMPCLMSQVLYSFSQPIFRQSPV